MSRIKWLRFAWNRIMNIQLNWFIPKKVRHAFVKWHVSNIFIKTTRSVFSSRGHATDKLSAGFFVTPTRSYITNEWFYSYVNAAQALSTSATWITCFVFFHTNSIISPSGETTSFCDWTIHHNCGYRNTSASCH